jgi:hypothetical protein
MKFGVTGSWVSSSGHQYNYPLGEESSKVRLLTSTCIVFTLYRRLLSPTVTYHHSCDLPGAGYTLGVTIEKERKKWVRELHVLSLPRLT